jgi:hypothetical protein
MMHRTLVRTAVFVALGGAIALPAVASHSWNNYHWARTASSFDLQVVDSVTSQWQTAFDMSLQEWGKSSKFDNVVSAADGDARTRKRCPMVAGEMRVCNASYGQNGWLGMATINLDSNGHITRGTAKMNDSYDWYFAATPGEDNHVMCQETGHVYGLGHTSEDGSSQNTCMDYSSSLTSQWPNQHDYDELDQIYGHVDSYDSYAVAGGSGGGGGSGCTAPPGKGCNKHEAPHGGVPAAAIRVHYAPGHDRHLGHADYVLPDGKGGLWLFHLTLIPEDARQR